MRKISLTQYHPKDIKLSKCLWMIINRHHETVSTTDHHAQGLGYQDNHAIEGATSFDLKVPSVELAPLFFQQDRHVMQSRQCAEFLNFNVFADNQLSCLHTRKLPIIDDSNTVIGCEIRGATVNVSNLMPLLLELYAYASNWSHSPRQFSFTIVEKYSQYGLSARESGVLFLLGYGYSVKQISGMLYLSHRTVETHVNNIKIKLKLATKKQLIQYCIFSGLHEQIPKNLLAKLY